ncbi:ThiF family adenylyltransferase [Paracoccus pacificus]|uniref:ThiF family adenylyltransferase n=1 Tax=Paracoccus pacificus TaxID=1463598 RepID=A0ABW4RBQ7_9RHOB
MSRYARQICLPGVGAAGQARLAKARVLVVGAGGLGASLLPALAGAGIGELTIIDGDRVEESNLHRQTLFRMSDLGRPKAEVAAETLTGLNPDCRIVPVVGWLDPANAHAFLRGADVVVDAADMFAVTYVLSDLCHALRKPLISASVLGTAGYVGGFCGGAPSYRAVFPDLPAQLQSCATGGVMGPAVATMGALQAQMCLAIVLGHRPSPLGQVISVDLGNWRLSGFRFDFAPEPPRPTPAIVAEPDLRKDDLVIELRGAEELPVSRLPMAARLTAEEIARLEPRQDQRVVFVCATGLRAWRGATALAARGHPDVAILADRG